MPHLKFFKDISKDSVHEAGGKGASLGEMTQAGISVPPGFVVLAQAFDRFVEETHLKQEIEARLKEVNPNDMNSVEKASNILRDVIHDTPMPDDLGKEILLAFDELGAEWVAVRSSATAEDSLVASWAGELETYLNIRRENVVDKVKTCWSSLFTPRAIFYRHEKDLMDAHVSVAVVIQTMVQSEISGIAFTVHPVTEDRDQMIIEAGFGLGEAIVSGQITPDAYVVSKKDMMILDINVASQTRKLIRTTDNRQQLVPIEASRTTEHYRPSAVDRSPSSVDGSNEWIELMKEDGGKQKLNGKQIMELAEMCKQIEVHYGFPCDIEWAFAEEKFFITQSRPITTLK